MTATADLLAQFTLAATLGGSTFFAPCAFPLLPGYVAFFLGASDDDGATTYSRLLRAATVGLVASAGFFLVFGTLGAVVSLVGTGPLANIGVLELVVGAVLVVLGAAMASGRAPQWHVRLPERRRTVGGFFLFGVVYAVAAAGCTAPLFVAVVTRGLAQGSTVGGLTLVAYGSGMAAMMVGVTGLAALGRGQVLRRLTSATGRIQRAAGVMLVVAGGVQIGYYLFWLGGWQALAG